ncbi:Scr1 family TA system antitoxin-like transcriptional regulator [Streptomyces sp. NPDC059477]|uniref:helix-turn-helix domain-containing protein n=1 Tax=Streptomyces sp. NPDC059477 TaxID=3346847 RepID=UPI0036D15F5C
MPAKKDPDASESIPSFYGAELRYRRELAGLTLEQMVEGSFRGASYLSLIERGERRMPPDLARHVDKKLGTDGFFERRCEDTAKARRVGHSANFEDVPDLEKQAMSLEEWQPEIIPGLLQTAAYMSGLIRHGAPYTTPETAAERISARMARAKLWELPDRPQYWAIVRESVIRNTPLSAVVMAEQLEHVAALIRSTQSVFQIVPETTFWHPLRRGTAKIMTFADSPQLVWADGNFVGQMIDYPPLVRQYRQAYDLLRAAALSPEASLALIDEAARTYRDEADKEARPA